jgi:hypothetical protein
MHEALGWNPILQREREKEGWGEIIWVSFLVKNLTLNYYTH